MIFICNYQNYLEIVAGVDNYTKNIQRSPRQEEKQGAEYQQMIYPFPPVHLSDQGRGPVLIHYPHRRGAGHPTHTDVGTTNHCGRYDELEHKIGEDEHQAKGW